MTNITDTYTRLNVLAEPFVDFLSARSICTAGATLTVTARNDTHVSFTAVGSAIMYVEVAVRTVSLGGVVITHRVGSRPSIGLALIGLRTPVQGFSYAYTADGRDVGRLPGDGGSPNASRSESVTCSSNWFVNTMAPSSLRKSRQLGEGCDVTGASGETTQLRLGCQEGDTFEFGLTFARLY